MNKYAKFVVRALQFGSEPLFDDVLRVNELAQQVREAKARVISLHIPVTVSDLAYSYQKVSDEGALPLVFILVSSEWRSTPHYLRNWHDRCACVTLLRAGCVDRFVSNKYIQGPFICKFGAGHFVHSEKRLAICSKECGLVCREWPGKEDIPQSGESDNGASKSIELGSKLNVKERLAVQDLYRSRTKQRQSRR